MSKKHKKGLQNFELYLPLTYCIFYSYTITGCVSISVFTSLVGIPIGVASSTMGLKICVITAEIKKYKLIRKRRSMVK